VKKVLLVSLSAALLGALAACSTNTHPGYLGDCDGCGAPILPGGDGGTASDAATKPDASDGGPKEAGGTDGSTSDGSTSDGSASDGGTLDSGGDA
jgi:hypothetical protein